MGDFGDGIAYANSDWVNALWPVFGFEPQLRVMTGSSKDAAEEAARHAQGCLDELLETREQVMDCDREIRKLQAQCADHKRELEELMQSMGTMAAENIRLSLQIERLNRRKVRKGGEE